MSLEREEIGKSLRAAACIQNSSTPSRPWSGDGVIVVSRGTIYWSCPLEWQHDSEMSPVINRLRRRVFTHASEGISSLSIHCTVTAPSQKWINQSSVLRSPPTIQTCQLFPCSAAVNQGVVFSGAEEEKKSPLWFLLKCSVFCLYLQSKVVHFRLSDTLANFPFF